METRNRKVFGVYKDTAEAQRAVEELLNLGYGSEEISVLSKHKDDLEVIEGADTATEAGLKGGAVTGATIGGLGGLLAGLGALAIPGIGPILAAGPLAAALTGALAGGAIGGTIGTLGGALIDAGMSEDDARYVDERFQEGDIIVYVDSDEARIDDVSRTLNYSDRGGLYEPTSGLNPDVDLMNEAADVENYSGRDLSGELDRSGLPDENFVNDPLMKDPVGGTGTLGSDDLGTAKPDPVKPVYDNERFGEDYVGGERIPTDNLTEHDKFRDKVQSDRDYASAMAGAGRVNPVDPTIPTGYTGEEFKPIQEEPFMDNKDNARHEADRLGRNPFEKAKDWVEDKVDDVKEAFDGDGRNDLGEDVERFGDKVHDKTIEARHEVEKTVEKIERRIDNAGEPLEDVQNWAGDKVSEAKHEAEETIEKVKHHVDE